jgi:hypothetical protein
MAVAAGRAKWGAMYTKEGFEIAKQELRTAHGGGRSAAHQWAVARIKDMWPEYKEQALRDKEERRKFNEETAKQVAEVNFHILLYYSLSHLPFVRSATDRRSPRFLWCSLLPARRSPLFLSCSLRLHRPPARRWCSPLFLSCSLRLHRPPARRWCCPLFLSCSSRPHRPWLPARRGTWPLLFWPNRSLPSTGCWAVQLRLHPWLPARHWAWPILYSSLRPNRSLRSTG